MGARKYVSIVLLAQQLSLQRVVEIKATLISPINSVKHRKE